MISRFEKRTVNNMNEYIPFDQRAYYAFVLGLFVFILLSLFTLQALYAGNHGKVIVINSDMSVDKYNRVQTELKSRIDNIETIFDLGSKLVNESKIKGKILEIGPDVICCIGSKAFQFAEKFTEDKNIVFAMAINWRRFPIGENTYGVSNELPLSMQLMTYRYFFPDIKKIGVLYSKAYQKEWMNIAVKSARELDFEIIGKPVNKTKYVKKNLKKLLPDVDAVMLIPDPIVMNTLESVNAIFEQSAEAQKPVFAYSKAFVYFGPALIVAPDLITMGKQTAVLAQDLIKGHKFEEKVKNPAGTHIILNLTKAEEYGMDLNEDALDSVNEIIR